MQPTNEDVQEMVGALMTVANGIERAKQRGDAGTLALMIAVATRQQARPSDVSGDLGVHQSSVTRQVQALETAGYVEVTADPSDGRSCILQLTEAGHGEMQRLIGIGLSRFAVLVADWDADEVQTLTRLLNKLEQSKATLSAREAPAPRRRWQRKPDEH